MNIRLWNVEGKALNCIESGHTNNIFSVQFLPCGQDDIIISAAGKDFLSWKSVSLVFTYSVIDFSKV